MMVIISLAIRHPGRVFGSSRVFPDSTVECWSKVVHRQHHLSPDLPTLMELGRVTPDSGSPEDAGDLGLGERSTRPPSPSDSTSTSVSANKPASLLAYFGGRSIAPRPDSSIERTLSEQAGNKKTRAKMAQTLSSSKQTLLFSAMPTSSEGADEDLSANSASGGSSRWQLGIPKTDDITSGKAVRGRKRKKATKDEEAEVKAMVKAAKEAAKDAQVLESDTASKGKKTGKQEANAMLYEGE